jgi:predicted phosphodiesterase
MKLHILSDLHIEFAPHEIMSSDADVVILAGDIHLGDKGFKWAYDNIKNKEVIYVLGNHEFYREATPKLINKLRDKSKGTNIHVLENESVAINGVRFFGCSLWTDFRLLDKMDISMAQAALQMNDYKKIRVSPTYQKCRPSYTVVWHNQSKKWLFKEIQKCEESKIVVITHHAPSILSIREKDRNDPLRAAYASNMDDLISSSNISLWIHGHIHTAFDYYIGKTRIISNPLGYPDTPKRGFNPELAVEIK